MKPHLRQRLTRGILLQQEASTRTGMVACVFVSVPAVELGAGSESETRRQGELPVRDGAYRKLPVDRMLRRRCALQ